MNRFAKMSLIFSILFLIQVHLAAQDRAAITSTIHQLFDGMMKGDSAMVRDAFYGDAPMTSVYNSKDGVLHVSPGNLQGFLDAIGTPHPEAWNEHIDNVQIDIDGPMASAWMDYEFYLGERFNHCGVNHMIMVRTDDGWKIQAISDTRRKSTCDPGKEELSQEALLKEIGDQIWTPFIRSYNAYDAEAFNGLHTDDMTRITDRGITTGEQYKSRNLKSFDRNKLAGTTRSIQLYFINRHVNQNTAYEIGYYKVEITKPTSKKPDYYYGQFHVTSEKIKGHWYIVQDQDMSEINGVEVDEKSVEGLEVFQG